MNIKSPDSPSPLGERPLASLTHLQRLEAQSIQIMREVVAEVEKPLMLYPASKDSAVMAARRTKGFYPAAPPFPSLHVDTTWKFSAMYAFPDQAAQESGMELLVQMVREMMGSGEFVEVRIDTPLAEAEARDVQGLYKKARSLS